MLQRRIEYTNFHIRVEHGRAIDFNGDVLSFTLHLMESVKLLRWSKNQVSLNRNKDEDLIIDLD